tara:strand:+ start:2600 stop:3901 length:1302 start_codon:yes stop_codon:yes gene_type:complete
MSRIVVTGMGILAPKFGTLDPTMQALIAGKSAVEPLQGTYFELLSTRIGGLIPNNILEELLQHPSVARISRRAFRPSKLALAATLQALTQAQLLDESDKIPMPLQTRTAAYIGTGVGPSEQVANVGKGLYRLKNAPHRQQEQIHKEIAREHVATAMAGLPDSSAFQASQAFGIMGMIGCLIKACATGAGNIQLGAILLEGGYTDIAVCGGTESLGPNDVYPFSVYARNGALSKRNHDPHGASRPFDQDHDGFVPAEGAGILVLETAQHALLRGITPLAELAGWGELSDAKGATDPDSSSQAATILAALEKAGTSPEEVEVFVSHGTSTTAGDESELKAFKLIFNPERTFLTAPKSVTGHTLGATSAMQAIFGIEMIRRQLVPGILNLVNPIPEAQGLNLVQTTLHDKEIRTLVCNAAGFGGQNVCLVIKKWEE